MSASTRRRFLQVVFSMAAATTAGATASGCSRGRRAASASPSKTSAASATPTSTAPSARPDWAALARGLEGPLVRPGQDGYATARLLYNTRFDAVRPAAVAFCANPADVAECLTFARRYGLPLAPRAGGHSYLGASTTPGLVVDVTRMRTVRADTGAGRAVVGAGARLVDVYAELAAHGVTVPAGSCPTVGVTGLTLGGGIGVTSRAYGLTSDNLLAATIVTADGRVRACDANREPDLFWALRGGGGGNFGVVTSLTFRTHPARQVSLFFLGWPWRRAAAVLTAWQAWAPTAPDALWSTAHALAAPGSSTPRVKVNGLFLGGLDELERQLDRLYARVGSAPESSTVQASSYQHAMMVMAGCSRRSVTECHLPWQTPGGELERESYAGKSDIATRPLSSAGVGTLLREVERRQQARQPLGGGVLLDALGGAVNRVPAAETAFVHRDGLFTIQYLASWRQHDPAAAVRRNLAWLRGFRAAMRPHVSGQAYQNYADEDLTDWQRAYYGTNYARLVRVKARYDPDELFRPPQGIPPR